MRNLNGSCLPDGSLDWNFSTARPQVRVGRHGLLVIVAVLQALLSLAVVLAQTGATSPNSGSTTSSVGVIVEAVRPGSVGERAGLQVGDWILS